MRFVTTKSVQQAPPVSFSFALFEGIAPDGGLYVPESIPAWSAEELARLSSMTLAAVGARVLQPFVDELDYDTLLSILEDALAFAIPLVPVEPGIYALELFHGPTLAFKDVGARVMARLMAALFRGDNPLTILVATSGDTGSAVAHAFHDVPHTRVAILYPKGRVSPTQEAQLTMFNDEATNVRAYATAGSFDDCQRLTKAAFADPVLSRRANLTSANSINIGRLLPQMIYYAHAVGQLAATRAGRGVAPGRPARNSGSAASAGVAQAASADERGASADEHGAFADVAHGAFADVAYAAFADVGQDFSPAVFSTPSGNFGNLTAGLMAKRAGIDIRRFVAATNVNDVVPEYLVTGHFKPRPSIHTLANAMDVGNPSNFDRLMWLYGSDLEAIRRDVAGSCHDDDEVRATIRKVYEERGYLLDPHSAIAYLGLKGQEGRDGRERQGVFLATAHPAKFAEVVEPIVGRPIPKPPPLVEALAAKRKILEIDATLAAVENALG
jgi:threonine synthase